MRSVGSITISLILLMTVAGGGLLHAVVPHSHGDDHNPSHESPIWTDLHQALNHEGKKTLLAIIVVIAVIVVMMISQIMSRLNVSPIYLREISLSAKARDPSAGELLRRGIHPYRAFG